MRTRKPKFKYTKTDVESVQLIKKLPKAHQPIVGRVIWWDAFGHRLVSKRTAAFDHWLTYAPSAEPEPAWESLVKSLMKMGYPEDIAIRKMRPKFQKRPNQKEATNAN